MALEYALHCNGPEDSLSILRFIVAKLQPGEKIQGNKAPVREEAAFRTRYYSIDVGPLSDNYQALLQAELGICVDKEIFFRLDKWVDQEEAQLSVARVTAMVLQRLAGDAALVLNGDWVLLLRRQGQLVLNQDVGFWAPARLAAVQVEYKFAPLPMI